MVENNNKLLKKIELNTRNSSSNVDLSGIENRLSVLENKVDNDTIYDDTAIKTAIGYDSIDVANDGDLESRISSLESQPAGSSYDDTEILDRLTVIEDAVGIREITIVIKRWGRSYVQINNTTKRMEGDAFNDVQQQVTFRVADGEYDVKLGDNFSDPMYYITKHITVDSTHTLFVIDGDDYI